MSALPITITGTEPAILTFYVQTGAKMESSTDLMQLEEDALTKEVSK